MSENEHNYDVPKHLQDHCMAGKYEYIETDRALQASNAGFMVDCLKKPLLSPPSLNRSRDAYEEMKKQQMEEGDYLLVCPVKAGQHWTWEIMSMLIAGKAEYINSTKEFSWLDATPLDEIQKRYPKPRVLCTHVSLGWMPDSFRKPETKVVITLRNFKDVFVSYHCFMRSITKAYGKQTSQEDDREMWNACFKLLMDGKYVQFGDLFDHYADAWDNYRHDSNALIVFYEDLKQNIHQEIERIAKHLGVVSSPELVREIAEAVDINKMKSGKKDAPAFTKAMKEIQIYRKGGVGDWKNWFTVAQNEEFHRKFDEWNKERQIPMKFC